MNRQGQAKRHNPAHPQQTLRDPPIQHVIDIRALAGGCKRNKAWKTLYLVKKVQVCHLGDSLTDAGHHGIPLERSDMPNPVFYLILVLCDIVFWVVLVSVIVSWLVAFRVLNLSHPGIRRAYEFITGVTDRLYAPIRRVMPTVFGGVDISPVVVLIILKLIQYTIVWLSTRFGL